MVIKKSSKLDVYNTIDYILDQKFSAQNETKNHYMNSDQTSNLNETLKSTQIGGQSEIS